MIAGVESMIQAGRGGGNANGRDQDNLILDTDYRGDVLSHLTSSYRI
jgi:hypothetical protein